MSESELGAHERPGHLTALMRAATPPAGPAVLRVAIVEDGRCCDERVFDEPSSVTIGPRESDTFVLLDAPKTQLFEPHGNGFRLIVPTGVQGRIAKGAAITPLSELAGRAVTLELGMKGKLTLGGVTLLFSFERAAARVAVARPADLAPVRRSIGMDWNTTIVAAMSFLFHFGVLGSIYTDWSDPIVDDDLTISKLVESVRDLPAVPIEDPTEAVESQGSVVPTKEPAKVAADKRTDVRGNDPQRGNAPSKSGPMTARDAANLSNELAAMNVEMMGVLDSKGASTDRVISDSTVPVSLLDATARNGDRVAIGKNDFGFGGPAWAPESTKKTLAELGDKGTDQQPKTVGSARAVEGPKVQGQSSVSPQPPPDFPEAAGVIAGLSGGFRRCYLRGLESEDPSMKGGVKLVIKVGPNGEVAGVTATPTGSVSGTVAACMAGKAQGAQFPKPPSGGATIFAPVSVFPQK